MNPMLKSSFGGYQQQSPEHSFNTTEDPFVTAGIIAIEILCGKSFEKCSNEDLAKAVDILLEWYMTPAWTKELYSIFPNSKYVNASLKDKKGASKSFLLNLISEVVTPSKKFDKICQFCGKPSDDTFYAKTEIPLAGSSLFSNFFPSFQDGINVCPRCVLAIQFAPLICYKAGGKPCLISSGNSKIIYEYGKEIITTLKSRLTSGEFFDKEKSGLFSEDFKNPENALFNLAYKFGSKYVIEGICSKDESIVLYHLDNYNQNPRGIAIYHLPSNVFSFVSSVMNSPQYKKNWYTLLSRYYSLKNQQKDSLPIWKTSKNRIHTSLLANTSIIWAFKDDQSKTSILPWDLVEEYCKKVRFMNQQRINDIKFCADQIAETIRLKNNKKRVNAIVSSKTSEEFRNQIRLSMVDWQKLGKTEPMIDFDQFTRVIIPGDYRGWTEVRDLIVVRLYEQLHDILAKDSEQEIESNSEE
ncbi:type I-B CRISPR-associated protein Cas8b1/Cst1 [Methanospirillum purgamenti]|uniref:Type I-B CRISPR-associated protein Cas8b1/Cst1 n=1 Tax=Methanospirillum hungatei TaxID=2203 RepID=A0A8F5VM85_METHU|nr:type I-B CRISPR-associated protein Cas8b1/Cst1 [Methanospirillum hungatei]QXO95657.1 type I-B CRISPR-associated protein Cas8b1/Cst1 [Methanospirillum hungatei]